MEAQRGDERVEARDAWGGWHRFRVWGLGLQGLRLGFFGVYRAGVQGLRLRKGTLQESLGLFRAKLRIQNSLMCSAN